MMDADLVNISDLNQYLYCPRRLYYLMFYQTQGMNFYLADGRSKHAGQGRRGGWYREIYLRSERFHLQGKVDLLEMKDTLVPVERKHGRAYFENDEMQLTAYGMLLEEYLDEPVPLGYIYLYGTNTRHLIEITDQRRKKVFETVEAIRSMNADEIPDFCANSNKCRKCSVERYCMPYEMHVLEGG